LKKVNAYTSYRKIKSCIKREKEDIEKKKNILLGQEKRGFQKREVINVMKRKGKKNINQRDLKRALPMETEEGSQQKLMRE